MKDVNNFLKLYGAEYVCVIFIEKKTYFLLKKQRLLCFTNNQITIMKSIQITNILGVNIGVIEELKTNIKKKDHGMSMAFM